MATKRDFVITNGLQTDKTGAGTNTLVVDSVNDRVGIAVSTPLTRLNLDANSTIGFNRATTSISSIAFAVDNATTTSIETRYVDLNGVAKQKISFEEEGGSWARKAIVFYTTNATDSTTAGTERLRISANGLVTVGSQVATGNALSLSAPAKLYIGTGTYTDTTTAASGTVTHGAIVTFDNPAIAAANSTVTYTNASTVYIDGAPTNGTNVTITNPYSLYVNTGKTYIGGNLEVNGSLSEYTNGSYWNIVSQYDIGYGAAQIPLNQYLGQLAFLDQYSPYSLRRDGGASNDVFIDTSGNTNINGNIILATAKNITADFTNATLISRTYLQTSTANSSTTVGAIPSGTGTSSAFYAFNNSTTTNAPYVGVTIDASNAYLRSFAPGSGAALPLTIETQNRTSANSAAITINTGTTTTSGTTGAVTIKSGNSAAVSGNLDISTGTGTTSGNITIDVGNGSTTDGTITIGGTNAASVTLPSARTKIGNTTLTQGGSVTITLPTLAGTLYATGNTDVALADGGTNASLTAVNGGVVYSSATAMAITAAGTAGQALVSAGAAAPSFQTLTLENLPDAWVKRAVKAATTADLAIVTATATTLTGTAVVFPAQDGITLALNDRLLVKNQTAPAQNGIYTLTTVGVAGTTAWVLTRAADADSATELAGAAVAVDQGTTQGGFTYDCDFKSTDTIGTTAVNFSRILDESTLLTSTSTSIGSVKYNRTTAAAGQFDGGTTTPTATNRLNYGGYFYPTFLNLAGSADTATTATHYFVETGSDGFVRPKTLANVRTEIVTTAAVNAAAATTLGTVVGLNLAAGTTTVEPLQFTSGVNLTTAAAGAVEYDGSFFYMTRETTSGRGAVQVNHTFRLAAAGSAIGPTIADFFGANSSINLAASSVYEIDVFAYFTKTTAGTATWTLTASSAPTVMFGVYESTPITGIGAGAPPSSSTSSQAATTAAFGASGSLSTGVNHIFTFKITVVTNLATNFRLQLTQSAGTATPLAGSYYTVNRISASQGSFAA
jgi:hypothetical protein